MYKKLLEYAKIQFKKGKIDFRTIYFAGAYLYIYYVEVRLSAKQV
ncbi:hypothetical protein [Arcicella rigui]|uniref:HEPN domain-containing protein n=1 Tax=Arcicella rigui TaxID=797020 RepID=A0ABU5QAT4_9BACT|nr:hypothetical protein [Arcicella rigui]MEA5139692.1 hypothetical protein [Arcicella rigui]